MAISCHLAVAHTVAQRAIVMWYKYKQMHAWHLISFAESSQAMLSLLQTSPRKRTLTGLQGVCLCLACCRVAASPAQDAGLQAQYTWKVDQLQQQVGEQHQECLHLKSHLQAAHKVSQAAILCRPWQPHHRTSPCHSVLTSTATGGGPDFTMCREAQCCASV